MTHPLAYTGLGCRLLMKHSSLCAVFLACLGLLLCAPAPGFSMGGKPHEFSVGMQTFGVWEAAEGERFDFAVFYPTAADERGLVRDGWRVQVAEGARITPGFYPVILLSHDTASSRFANNDTASALASKGFIVVAPTHMGDSQSDSSGLYTAQLLASRPRQLLLALETVLADQKFAPYADESRIGLLGVGFGAVTMVQLAGARPELSVLDEYCGHGNSLLAAEDPFCAPWVAHRLSSVAAEMQGMEKKNGPHVFTPPLTLFAPALEDAPIILPMPDKAPQEKQANGQEGKSFWQKLFGSDSDAEQDAAEAEATRTVNATEAVAPSTNSTDAIGLALDFDGGPLFGSTDSGMPFVYLALPDSPFFRVAVADDASADLAPPVVLPAQQQKSPIYLRPAATRRIQALALLVPAGGMLFSRESLAAVNIPVGIVEADADELYPPEHHSRPYFSQLSGKPQLLHLTGVDHFSLFAICSNDIQEKLHDMCGRLDEGAREDVHQRRDAYLVSFFQSVLGHPETPPLPSGFVAKAKPPPEEKKPVVQEEKPPVQAPQTPARRARRR